MVKPSARYLGRTAGKVGRYRPWICRAAALLPLPDGFVVEPQEFGRFKAEWVEYVGDAAGKAGIVVLYLPGGAFSMGSPITHRGVTTRLARYAGARVLALRYRKVPEHPYPAALEDALLAYEWLLDRGSRPEDIVIAGDSAGGNLTLATLLAIRDRRLPRPAGAALMSPWLDLAGRGASMRFNAGADAMIPRRPIRRAAEMYANGLPLDHPGVSPLYADLSGLPPLLAHAGDQELLLSDATRLADRASAAGVDVRLKIWRNTPHAFQLFAGVVPQSKHSLRQIGSFIRQLHTRPAVPVSRLCADSPPREPEPQII